MSKLHRSVRPKGYMTEWSPNTRSQEIIEQVQDVIRAGRFGAMSVRFIFYRLVGNFGYPKTERDYKNLAELLVKARRAQLIPFSAIFDNGTTEVGEMVYVRASLVAGTRPLDVREWEYEITNNAPPWLES